jgi:hypothetical protein
MNKDIDNLIDEVLYENDYSVIDDTSRYKIQRYCRDYQGIYSEDLLKQLISNELNCIH